MTIEFRDSSSGVFTLESRDGLSARVTAQTHWFQVAFDESFMEGEFEGWAAGLRKLDADMAGSYAFRAMRGWLQITYAMAKKGELHVSILLQNAPDYLNEVRLFLNLPQSCLPAMADEIAEFAMA